MATSSYFNPCNGAKVVVVVVVAAAVVVVVGTGVCDVVGATPGDEVVGANSWPVQAVSPASKATRALSIKSQGIPVASMSDNA